MSSTPSLVLTRDELIALLDTKQPKRMCDRLKARRWVYEPPTRRGDIPKVDRAYYLARMSGQQPDAPKRRGRMNLDWMTQPAT